MRVQQIPTSGFAANCWLLLDEETMEAAVIDPSADASAICDALEQMGATLTMILLTHGHFDHITAADALRDRTGAPLLIHEKDGIMLTDGVANASALFFGKPEIYRPADRLLKGGDALPVGKTLLTVRHTPGHTPGSVCFVAVGALFTGDTLFAGNIGRTDLPGGSTKEMKQSLRRISFMPGEYTVYSGHGEVTTLSREREINPFLQETEIE